MALPHDLGDGGSGFHGDVAVRVRALLAQLEELVPNFNALLAKLDADSGVSDTNYESTLEV